jgi:hypothetical protein
MVSVPLANLNALLTAWFAVLPGTPGVQGRPGGCMEGVTNRQLASCVSRQQQQQQQQQAPLPALVLLQPPQQTTSSSWTQAWLRAWRHC